MVYPDPGEMYYVTNPWDMEVCSYTQAAPVTLSQGTMCHMLRHRTGLASYDLSSYEPATYIYLHI